MVEINGEGAFPGRNAFFLNYMEGLARYGGGGIYHPYPGTCQPFDDRLEEGIMGAAKDYDIGPLLQQGAE